MDATSLRPSSWDAYIGQEALKRRLDVHIESALARGTRLPHTLLIAPPGYGKSSIAELIALRMCDDYEMLDQPLSSAALSGLIYKMREGILVLDEIHRYPKSTQEDLLPLIQEGYIRVAGGSRRLELPGLTIIGATTEAQDLIKPLYERFEASCMPPFSEYSDDELALIVVGMAARAGVGMDSETAMALGRGAAGVPRIAQQFVIAARDLGTTDPTAILEFCQVDPDGLTQNHLIYLRTLEQLGGLKGVGLNQICSMMRIKDRVVRDFERLLFTRGLVVPTSTGRALTPQGMERISTRSRRVRVVA